MTKKAAPFRAVEPQWRLFLIRKSERTSRSAWPRSATRAAMEALPDQEERDSATGRQPQSVQVPQWRLFLIRKSEQPEHRLRLESHTAAMEALPDQEERVPARVAEMHRSNGPPQWRLFLIRKSEAEVIAKPNVGSTPQWRLFLIRKSETTRLGHDTWTVYLAAMEALPDQEERDYDRHGRGALFKLNMPKFLHKPRTQICLVREKNKTKPRCEISRQILYIA